MRGSCCSPYKIIKKLTKKMKEKGKLAIAFSGGVDSGVVAKIAYLVLHENAVAITVSSESLSRHELSSAKKLAKEIGIKHIIVSSSELSNKNISRNPKNRCYFCRKELANVLKPVANSMGINFIADGTNYSDINEYRPGILAANEEGIWHPLLECKIDKENVRKLARALKLSVYDKPSMACLFSRFPYGDEITIEKLRMVEEGEKFLRKFRIKTLRIRTHGKIARIEVGKEELKKIFEKREKIVKKLKELGYTYVTLDLEGYRSGSMDEANTKI
ncbi:MAG: ATP-dependent sacrificial sulfur transferase LarE [Candidatus Thermoplasmatota archaeon]